MHGASFASAKQLVIMNLTRLRGPENIFTDAYSWSGQREKSEPKSKYLIALVISHLLEAH